VTLVRADLSQTDLSFVDLSREDLTRASIRTATFSACILYSPQGLILCSSADFTDANLTRVDLSGALLEGMSFGGANLFGANLSSAHLNGSSFVGANLTNANLAGADTSLIGPVATDFTGAIWSNTTCPDGTNSNRDGSTCVGHL
jgi:uncharacterized protein YjbI with pentapeptide repeats